MMDSLPKQNIFLLFTASHYFIVVISSIPGNNPLESAKVNLIPTALDDDMLHLVNALK